MRGILGLSVMACVVFGASLTTINTNRKTETSGKSRGTYPLPACSYQTLWDKEKVLFRRSNFVLVCKLSAKHLLKCEVIKHCQQIYTRNNKLKKYKTEKLLLGSETGLWFREGRKSRRKYPA